MHGLSNLGFNVREFGVSLTAGLINAHFSGLGVKTTVLVTAAGFGGTAGYTYAWARVSGTALTINSPATAGTTFSYNFTEIPSGVSAQFQCTVTDAAGLVEKGALVSVQMTSQ